MRRSLPVTLLLMAFSLPALARKKPFVDWDPLRNPILSYPDWSIKDAAMAYREGTFYVFFSAFYEDRGQVRCHVVEVGTRDFVAVSRPILNFDGREDGWTGMCSPDVQKMGSEYELSFNSWGERPGKPNQLFAMTSVDLVHWSPRRELAANLTAGQGAIDAALAHANGGYYLVWKQGPHPTRTRMAFAMRLSGPWSPVSSGTPALTIEEGKENGLLHENFEFIKIGGKWRLLSSDYPGSDREVLYTLRDNNWLDWGGGLRLTVAEESFNKLVHADAAALYDWRKRDGYYYLIYAGRNEQTSYLRRGWNRLGLSRSKDLIHWLPPGVNP